MKRVLAAAALSLFATAACSQSKNAEELFQPEAGRSEIPLSAGWKFLKADPLGAEKPNVNDAAWEQVSVPHTWNALDGADGGFDKKTNYLRTACWYHRHLTISPNFTGKELLLKFQGANRRTDVFVNGQKVGTHTGGFAAFTFDITKAAKTGDNLIAVRVTNEYDDETPPLSADFTFFGGLYRPVSLLVLDPVHISPLDTGSCGITIRTPDVSADAATVNVRTLVQNSTPDKADIHVVTLIADASNNRVAWLDQSINTDPNKTTPVDANFKIPTPHLWNGVKDPYLYHVIVDVLRDGKVVDELTQPLGLRSFSLDPKWGFILNGQPYNLHGVDRHQDRPNKGWAISDADHEEDIALIKEMGCTAIRLAHYQHAQHFYDLCDQAGIVVWAEVPIVNGVTPGKPFADNAKQQLTELIRQNINHPSICFWSLENEVSTVKGDPIPLFKEMNALAKKEDPSRLTTMAFAVAKEGYTRQFPGITDTFGQNQYAGWYRGEFADFPKFLATQGSIAISEYGAGSSIYFHSETPRRMDHTEEYQCIFHENYWPAIHEAPHVWGSFVWNMFDFAADQRKEGDHAGMNDKGLVTYDRKIRKDAFYYYKANWTTEPMVHINSKRFTTRGQQQITVKIYANTPGVDLVVNGVSLGQNAGKYCVFTWDKVQLKPGKNEILARGLGGAEDHCEWTYTPGAPTEVYIGQDDTMREELKKGPPQPTQDPTVTATQPQQ